MKSPIAGGAAAFATALVAGASARAVPLAAHDANVVRTVGAGFTGVFRALDAVVAAPMLLLPIGTRALRAGLASALVAAIAAALAVHVLFDLMAVVVPEAVARLGVRSKEKVSPALLGAVSVVAVLSAALAPLWQMDVAEPGTAALGALFVLGIVALAQKAETHAPAIALLLGLSLSYEPLAFIASALALAPHVRAFRPDARAIVAFALGLLPIGLGYAFSSRDPALALAVPLLSDPRSALVTSPIAFVREEIGVLLGVVALLGAALAFIVPTARRASLSLAGVVAAGAISLYFHRAGATLLAAFLAVHLLAGIALAAIVVAIARAPLPFAQASATLVVVLELVLPVRAADESWTRREGRFNRAAAWWNELTWGPAPAASIVLLPTPGIHARVVAAHALGEMRGDVVFVPAFDLRTRLGDRALASEPKLAPLYRDVALGTAPEELSFAQLADQRPVLAAFDARWDRSLARHLVPVGLLSRYEAEPRGVNDRRKALEAFTPSKDRLVRVTVARKDVDLAAVTASLLRARAIAMAATGDREVLSKALDDLRPFAPDDAVASTLVRRLVTSKGPIDVSDLGGAFR
jgi:hypothetical protein